MDYKDQIDRYLLGKFNEEEEKNFQQNLEDDTELAKDVKKRQSIISGLEALGNEKMAERIKSVRQKMKEDEIKSNPDVKKNNGRIVRMLLAAAAISALFFFSWQFLSNHNNNPEQLFAQSYQPYATSIVTRDVNSAENLVQADAFYKARNYQAAIPLLNTALTNQPSNSNLELAIGNAYLSSDQIDQAIIHFQNIIQRKDPLYVDQARWYLALSYLKNNQKEESKNLLNILVADSGADFHQEAESLLKKL